MGEAPAVKAEAFGGADGDIDDTALGVGSAVGDAEDFRAAVAKVGDADAGAHFEGSVGSGVGVILEGSSAGGAGAMVGADAIPGGDAVLGGKNGGFFGGLGFFLNGRGAGGGSGGSPGAGRKGEEEGAGEGDEFFHNSFRNGKRLNQVEGELTFLNWPCAGRSFRFGQ